MRTYQNLIWDLAAMLWRSELHPYPSLDSFKQQDSTTQEVFLATAAKLAGQLNETNWINYKGDKDV